MAKKQPPFKTETQEAEWWAKNQNLIADRFEQAKAAGKLGKGTVARVARERAGLAGASPTITIRLTEDDLTRARTFAAEKGLRYQTYLKMLLHQAAEREPALDISRSGERRMTENGSDSLPFEPPEQENICVREQMQVLVC